MGPIFRRFPGFNGGCRPIGSLKDDRLLGGRGDADVKGEFPPIHPILDEDVCRAGERSGDEPWHFFAGVEGSVLSSRENAVAETVMAARFHASIVAAVEGVISKGV